MSDEKSLPPSDRRRQEARESGVVARSGDLCALSVVGSVLALAALGGPAAVDSIREMLAEGLSTTGEESAVALATAFGGKALFLIAPVVVVALAAAIASNVLQVGWHFSGQRSGSRYQVMGRRTAMGLAHVAVLGGVLAWTVWSWSGPVFAGGSRTGDEMSGIVTSFLIRSMAALAAVGLLDYLIARGRHEAALGLSPAEALEEIRQTEGDPRLRERRRILHRRLVASRARESQADLILADGREVDVAQASKRVAP